MLKSQKKSSCFIANPKTFEEQLSLACRKVGKKFGALLRQAIIFHTTMLSLCGLQFLAFFLFFPFYSSSHLLGILLGSFFLSLFLYFTLHFYFQAKKPEQILYLKEHYQEECRNCTPFEIHSSDYHLSIAKAMYRLLSYIQREEGRMEEIPHPFLKKFRAWAQSKEILKMKESLLEVAIDEHLTLIRSEPTDLEVHASLGEAYTRLYKIYSSHRKERNRERAEEIERKFQSAALRALEEYKILDEYVPEDPWVHTKLASIYHDLGNHEEEAYAYESIIQNSPREHDVLFRLGTLYFEMGQNAKGLRIYEQLILDEYPLAKDLLNRYGH